MSNQEPTTHEYTRQICNILERKNEGVDCTEEESAMIKQWLKNTIIGIGDGTKEMHDDIQLLFPQEYNEYLHEEEQTITGAHVQGEWKVIFWGGKIEIRDANNNHIAFVKGDENQVTPNKETRDLAKLIAAAPKLLMAVEGILEIGKRDTSNPKYEGYWESMVEAYEKATGVKFSIPE